MKKLLLLVAPLAIMQGMFADIKQSTDKLAQLTQQLKDFSTQRAALIQEIDTVKTNLQTKGKKSENELAKLKNELDVEKTSFKNQLRVDITRASTQAASIRKQMEERITQLKVNK